MDMTDTRLTARFSGQPR